MKEVEKKEEIGDLHLRTQKCIVFFLSTYIFNTKKLKHFHEERRKDVGWKRIPS